MRFLFHPFRWIGLNIIFNAGALYAIATFLEGIKYTGGWKFFVIGGVTMGVLNAIVKPVLKIFSLPFIILTLGLMLAVINGFLLFLLEKIIKFLEVSGVSFQISGLMMYLIAGLVFGVVNYVEHLFWRR